MSPVGKVVAYVVRGDELLVFTHANEENPVIGSGLQVPAGTIEQGEQPVEAVLREAREETGLDDLEVVRELGGDTVTWPGHPPHRRWFFLLSTETTLDGWSHVETDGGSGPPRPFDLFWIPVSHAWVLSNAQGLFASRI